MLGGPKGGGGLGTVKWGGAFWKAGFLPAFKLLTSAPLAAPTQSSSREGGLFGRAALPLSSAAPEEELVYRPHKSPFHLSHQKTPLETVRKLDAASWPVPRLLINIDK